MHLPKTDVIAVGLVAIAGLLYVLWATGSALPGMNSTRATGVAVLALGFAASASAVVPGFSQLLHGSKTYLAVTSFIGVVAVIGGVQMLITGSGTGLAVVMAAMAVLWLIATIHHSLLAKTGLPPQQVTAHPAGPGATASWCALIIRIGATIHVRAVASSKQRCSASARRVCSVGA